MELGSIFSINEYDKGFQFAISNGYTIKEIESREEVVEQEVEFVNEDGEIETRKEKKLVTVRYFQIVETEKPTNKEISQQRQNAYTERTDPLTLRKLRKQALGEWTAEDEKEYVAQIEAISKEIEVEFPYNSEEPSI